MDKIMWSAQRAQQARTTNTARRERIARLGSAPLPWDVIMKVIGAILAVAAFVWIIKPRPTDDAADAAHELTLGAWTACQQFVEARLKAPATAQFPTVDQAAVHSFGSGRYGVESYVDAQNSFGAMLRSRYACALKYDGTNWRLDAINIE